VKIVILTASPQRDKVIDDLIANELRSRNHEVYVHPCLREGRKVVLEQEPDVVILPPIRNMYSRDFAEQLKKWNVGVVTRHTEASCDWQDYKKLNAQQKDNILGRFKYMVDAEIVWGDDEADILRRRGCQFPVIPVGSFAVDIYKQEGYREKFQPRQEFNKKYGFKKSKKNLLIGAPWGFADSAPDLHIEDTAEAKADEASVKKHIAMIRKIHKELGRKWNILLRPHPGVVVERYKKTMDELKIPLDNEPPATEHLVNCDALIHSGSTMAIEAHFLGIPAYQFGDVNHKSNNWWIQPDSPLSKVSKIYTQKGLIEALVKSRKVTNANKETLKTLEKGRYGAMDGLAYKRAADVICKIKGKFTMSWPESTRDYDQPTIMKQTEKLLKYAHCGVCNHTFITIKPSWIQDLAKCSPVDIHFNLPENHCPWCGARYFA
jgi:surface carbohydrate biosynthesis protein